jgi:hypothetical protein
MDRLKRYLALILIIYLLTAFVLAEINPMAWHWIARLVVVLGFVSITSALDLVFGLKK